MKKISILTVIISFLFLNLQAQQQSDIQNIRKWYQTTKQSISFSKKNKSEGSLYCDIFEKNSNGASWPAVGNFHIKREFWYSNRPDFLDNPAEGLEMVIVNGERSAVKFYEEFLFHGGQLVFAFYKEGELELRYYFKNKKLIKKLGDEEYDSMYVLSEEGALELGDIYIKQYLSSFGYENN